MTYTAVICDSNTEACTYVHTCVCEVARMPIKIIIYLFILENFMIRSFPSLVFYHLYMRCTRLNVDYLKFYVVHIARTCYYVENVRDKNATVSVNLVKIGEETLFYSNIRKFL